MHAIIGAGPMGLCTARQFLKYGIEFVGFEQYSDVGGLWDIKNPHSTMYESAHLISSKSTTEFTEFPIADDVAIYPHHSEMCRYFHDYAKHFDLYKHFHFNTRVLSVERLEKGWKLLTECEGHQRERLVDGVLIANGTLHTPNQPALPGSFSGELMHACSYRSADIFSGKRVLVIGCGNSACDIAVDAVHRAASVDISVRRGYYFLPKFAWGRPTDTVGGKLKLPRPLKQLVDSMIIRTLVGMPSQYGLPDPDYKLYESHPVMNSLVLHHLAHGDIKARKEVSKVEGNTVTFSDGQKADYDLILQATGYKLNYPFIDKAHLNWPETAAAPQLYLNVFHPQYDDLFVLGMVEASGLGWQGRDEQAELVALVIRQQQQNSEAAKTFRQRVARECNQREDGGYNYLKLDRMAYYVHKDTYRATLRQQIAELKK